MQSVAEKFIVVDAANTRRNARIHCAASLSGPYFTYICWIHRGKDWAEVELASPRLHFATLN